MIENKDKKFNNNSRLNYKEINETVSLAKKLLKVLLILGIGSIVILAIFILGKTQIFSILFNILKIISPLFIGIMIAWLFKPIIRKLEENKLSRKLASIIVYAAFALVCIILLAIVVPEFISQLKVLIGNIPGFISDLSNKLNGLDAEYINVDEIINSLNSAITNFTSNSLSGVTTWLGDFFSGFLNILIGIIIAFYFSLEDEKMVAKVRNYIPKKIKPNLIRILDEMNVMCRGYVSGTLLTSLLVAVITFIGLLISGITSPLLFAIFCGITNIIPYFGPYIGGIPTIIVAFSISPLCGIIATVTIVLVQFVEGNIINPIVVGKATDLHPIVLLVGLLVFEYYFGIIGMILATPIIGAFKILFNYYNEKYEILDRIKPNN